MTLVSFLLAIAGLAAMGLSKIAHYGWAFHGRPTVARVRILRLGGLLLCLASLAPAMRAWGPAHGAVGWIGILSLAAFALLAARTCFTPPRRR